MSRRRSSFAGIVPLAGEARNGSLLTRMGVDLSVARATYCDKLLVTLVVLSFLIHLNVT